MEDIRSQYKIGIDFCSWMFFIAQDLASVDHMYQFSIQWFIGNTPYYSLELYTRTVENLKLREESKIKTRAIKIMNAFKVTFYRQVKQAIKEEHLLIFEFLMTVRIIQSEGVFNSKVYDYFVNGKNLNDVKVEVKENTLSNYIKDEQWNEILYLGVLAETEEWLTFQTDRDDWIKFLDKEKVIDMPFEPNSQNAIVELALCKILRPDKLLAKIKSIITRILGADLLKQTVQPTFKDLIYQSSSKKPIMILQTLSKPFIDHLLKYAKEYNNTPVVIIPLGQEQGTLARKRIQDYRKIGGWVILENCHLYSSWMAELNELIEEAELIPYMEKDKLSPEYRLWLTSESDQRIPITILQKSIKCVYNPVKGVKSTMLNIYNQIANNKEELEKYEAHKKREDWNKLFMGLTFFHAILLERKRYGSIGLNGICEFNDLDLEFSKKTLYRLLEESTTFPFEALKKATLDYYGVHVLDVKDKDYLSLLLDKFYNDNVIYSNVYFSPKNKSYYVPNFTNIQKYIKFIEAVTLYVILSSLIAKLLSFLG